MRLAELLRQTRSRLAAAGVATPDLDAEMLVEHATGLTRLDRIRDSDAIVPESGLVALREAVARRLAGEPVHRILGWREFYGLRLGLSPDTLEPRPDTETLVDLALPAIRAIVERKGRCRLLDLGTGSGAIALAILSQIPQAIAVGADLAPGALATAAANAARLGLADRFDPVASDWFANLGGRFDAILSNPPYITGDEMAALPKEVAGHDPPLALHGGETGLDAYRAIAAGAQGHLAEGGFVAVEIGSRQRADVTALFRAAGFDPAAAATDLGGRDRALSFIRRV